MYEKFRACIILVYHFSSLNLNVFFLYLASPHHGLGLKGKGGSATWRGLKEKIYVNVWTAKFN